MTTATQFERQETEVIADRAPKSGSLLLLEAIAAQGVDTIFGYPGGAIMPVYDVLPSIKELTHILCRHEQGCGMAAIGYARATGKTGTALATSGPGATTLPMKIWSQVRLGVSPEINALSTMLIAAVTIGVIIASLSTKRSAALRKRQEQDAIANQ